MELGLIISGSVVVSTIANKPVKQVSTITNKPVKRISTITNKPVKQTVWLGSRIITTFASHWAVCIGDGYNGKWYEVDGGGIKNTKIISATINGGIPGKPFRGIQSRNGASAECVAGTTTRTDNEIERFNSNYLSRNPVYDLLLKNCQTYAQEFIQWLTGGCFTLPKMESGLTAWAGGTNAFSHETTGSAGFYATTGKAGAQISICKAEVEGPSFGVQLTSGKAGFGAFTDASVGRFEYSIGPASARWEPNLNTGFGVRNGYFEANIFGFGFSFGTRGIGINTPSGGISLHW